MRTNPWMGRKFQQRFEIAIRNKMGDEWYENNPYSSFTELQKYAQEQLFRCRDEQYYIVNRIRQAKIPAVLEKIYFNRYIVDIALPEKNTIIELDGSYHELSFQKTKDTNRDRVFQAFGFDVHRWPMPMKMKDLDRKIECFIKAYKYAAKDYRLSPIVRPYAVEKITPQGIVQKALDLRAKKLVSIIS